MKKEAVTENPLKHVTRVLSPISLIGYLISLSFITILLYNYDLTQFSETFRFSTFYGDKKQQVSSNVVDDRNKLEYSRYPNGQTKVEEPNDDLKGRKNNDIFAWSNELEDWTLLGDNQRSWPQEESIDVRACVWPEECSKHTGADQQLLNSEDRIVNQLKLFQDQNDGGDGGRSKAKTGDEIGGGGEGKIFKILPPTRSSYPIGQHLFLTEFCPINRCSITYDREEADALIFENSDVIEEPPKHRRMNQIWIAYLLESPCHTFDKRFVRSHRGKHEFNWTASYRSDSDIVTPYSKFLPFQDKVKEFTSFLRSTSTNNSSVRKSVTQNTIVIHDRRIYASSSTAHQRSLIRGKQGKVAWFASNCNAANNRLEYAKELAKHIQVDIYGRCGELTCDKWNQTGCFEMINKNYKFYLSFENSNCHQYITEKLFRNALGYNDLNYLILPIVMGPPQEEYLRYAPPGSFIHVNDFESPRELAKYLKLLDSDDALYYSYFHWKTLGRFIDTKFMCRVCSLLHETHTSGRRKSYEDIKSWWTTCEDRLSNGSKDCCF